MASDDRAILLAIIREMLRETPTKEFTLNINEVNAFRFKGSLGKVSVTQGINKDTFTVKLEE